MDVVAQTGGANCPRCQAAMSADDQFCGSCGYRRMASARDAATAEAAPLPRLGRLGASKKLGHLGAAQHAKQIKSARNAILLVAVLILLISGGAYYFFQKGVEEVANDPGIVLDQDVIRQTKIILGLSFTVGVVFFGLWYWARTNPFAACLTAFILYITNFIVGIAMQVYMAGKGEFQFHLPIMDMIIMFILFRGIKSGLAYKREMERARINPS